MSVVACNAVSVKCSVLSPQVKQEDLTRMDIRKREAMKATRTAFGADYEANLRMEAGPNPEKLARRKHQISSLYHQAKMKVPTHVPPGSAPLWHASLACMGVLCTPAGTNQPTDSSTGRERLAASVPYCRQRAGIVHEHARWYGFARLALYLQNGMALRQQSSLAGVGAAGVQVPGHQDKSRDTSKVWMVILFFRPEACLMDSCWKGPRVF